MAELFSTTPQNITQHLKNIYAEGETEQATTCKDFLQVQNEGGREVERKSTTEEFSVVQKEGKRDVSRNVTFYSLEAIIAVGYRVKSERGTQFRQWP